MAPFSEAEGVTVKRLYVAIKRGDMQLLQMGVHKLHEKFHTGHKFKLLDDLRQILSYVEEQPIPRDVKDLLIRTVNDILNRRQPEGGQTAPAEINEIEYGMDTAQTSEYKNTNRDFNQARITANETERIIFTPKDYNEISPVYVTPIPREINTVPVETMPAEPVSAVQNILNLQQSSSQAQTPVPQAGPIQTAYSKVQAKKENNPEQAPLDEVFIQPQAEPVQVIRLENTAQHESKAQLNQTTADELEYAALQEYQNGYIQDRQQARTFEYVNEQPAEHTGGQPVKPVREQIFTANGPHLNNVAVFYDDKTAFIDYIKNKQCRSEFDRLSLGAEINPMDNAAIVKSIVDVQTDEMGKIIKMLNTIKGNVYFVTASKSENVIKTLIQNGVGFQIPLVSKQEMISKKTVVIPLFGLSSIFACPKCGEKEYFGGFHNKILSLQCKNCASPIYPDVYVAQDFETNANPYYWVYAISSMSHAADIWILINPPLEESRALTCAFIKSAFQSVRPKKVYILSKEATKREYYKKILMEINSMCDVKADFQTQDLLCEEFIKCEMSEVRVSV